MCIYLYIACGDLDRLSHGILWPITRTNKMVEMFCSDIKSSFGFGLNVTRNCREDATWSIVDTSQCTVSPMQQSTIIMYSTYIEVVIVNGTENIMSPEIEQVNTCNSNIHTYICTLSCLFSLAKNII